MAGRSVIAVVTVAGIDQVSPTFTRVEFASPELAEFGTGGPIYDQRIKLIFPGATGQPPQIAGSDDWYDRWLAVPEAERGSMRTYSIRDLYGEGADRRLVVDFVLHLQPGFTGPASLWASQADVGQQLVVVGPRRGVARAGIEFQPGTASTILLAGDETAVPAMSQLLEVLPRETPVQVHIEVGDPSARIPLPEHAGAVVAWHDLPADAAPGDAFIAAVRASELVPGVRVWAAGEAAAVQRLRKHLFDERDVSRAQATVRGYWKRGRSGGTDGEA